MTLPAKKVCLHQMLMIIECKDNKDIFIIHTINSLPIMNNSLSKIKSSNSYSGSINYNDWDICHSSGVYKNGITNPFEVNIDPTLLCALNLECIKLYPNPAHSIVTIDYGLEANEKGQLQFYDVLGKKRLEVNLSNGKVLEHIIVSSFEKGIYFYRYLINDNINCSGKFNKE